MGNQQGVPPEGSSSKKSKKKQQYNTVGILSTEDDEPSSYTATSHNKPVPTSTPQLSQIKPEVNRVSKPPEIDLLSGPVPQDRSNVPPNVIRPTQANGVPNVKPSSVPALSNTSNVKPPKGNGVVSESFLCSSLPRPGNSNSSCHLNITGLDQITVECLFEAKCTNFKAEYWLLYAPIPPLTSFQGEGKVSVKLPSPSSIVPVCKKILDTQGRELLQIVIPVDQHPHFHNGLKVIVSFEVSLFTRELFHDPYAQIPYQLAAEEEVILATSDIGPYKLTDSTFQNYIRENGNMLFRNPNEIGEESIIYAQRIFYFLSQNFSCKDNDVKDRSILTTIKNKSSDCAGICILFCAILRCQELPARVVYGRLIDKAMAPYSITEFFVEDVGWIPADIAAMITKGRRLEKKSDGKLPFFGDQKPNFIALHCENEFQLDTIKYGVQTIDTLQTIPHWTSGQGNKNAVQSRCAWKETKRTKVEM